MGSAWCNGECEWSNNSCVLIALTCGDGTPVNKCDECSNGEIGCEGEDCSWMPRTSLCRDRLSDDVRTASVHLFADTPAAASKPSWFVNKVVVRASSDATYFAAIGQSYGYGGLQQVSQTQGAFIFSIWDQGDCDQDQGGCDPDDIAQTIACGTNVICTDFGGEGTGRKSILYTDLPPNLDVPYYFAVQASSVGSERMQYTGYAWAEQLGGWKFLSRIEVSTGGKNYWISSPYSFVEQWTNVNTLQTRAASFGPAWMAGNDPLGSDSITAPFVQIPSVTFSYGLLENHKHVDASFDTQTGGVTISTGGDTVQSTDRDQSFEYATSVKPQPLINLELKRACLVSAETQEEIEACLTSCSSSSVFKMVLSTDNDGGQTSYSLVNNSTGFVLDSGDGLSSNQLYTKEICLEPGEKYVFKIVDVDGICCGNGTGSYLLTFNGKLLNTGGEFEEFEAVIFRAQEEGSSNI